MSSDSQNCDEFRDTYIQAYNRRVKAGDQLVQFVKHFGGELSSEQRHEFDVLVKADQEAEHRLIQARDQYHQSC